MKLNFKISLLIVCLLLCGCAPGKRAIQIKGSDTMVNLEQAWAEEFMRVHPDHPVAITGGGSGTGVASLINKTADLAACSREMKKKEIQMAHVRKVYPYEILVAFDGIAIVVSPKNPIIHLSKQQLSDIFTDKINNWAQLGGNNKKIVALSRDRNSGTHVFFLEEIVKMGDKKNKNEFARDILMMPSSQAIVEEVAANSSAIGYIGLGYMEKRLKVVSISKDSAAKPVYPTIASIISKQYPISRPLYFYSNKKPKDKIKAFIDFALSKAGQKIVGQMDFVPLYH